MKKIALISFYSFVSSASLLFFLYLCLPKVLIKEKIANILTQQTKSIVTINDISINFPLGISLYDLKLYQPNLDTNLNLKKIDISINCLSLLSGNIASTVNIQRAEKSRLELSFRTNGFPKAKQTNNFLSSFNLKAENFDFSDYFNFIMAYNKISSEDLGILMLADTKIKKGSITADISIDKMADLSQAFGKIDFKINNLTVNHPSLKSDQEFNKVTHLKAEIKNNSLALKKTFYIKSEGLNINLSGKISPLNKTNLDLKLKFQVFNEFKNLLNQLILAEISFLKNLDSKKESYSLEIKGLPSKLKTIILP